MNQQQQYHCLRLDSPAKATGRLKCKFTGTKPSSSILLLFKYKIVYLAWAFLNLRNISSNGINLIKLAHCEETKKMAHDSNRFQWQAFPKAAIRALVGHMFELTVGCFHLEIGVDYFENAVFLGKRIKNNFL